MLIRMPTINRSSSSAAMRIQNPARGSVAARAGSMKCGDAATPGAAAAVGLSPPAAAPVASTVSAPAVAVAAAEAAAAAAGAGVGPAAAPAGGTEPAEVGPGGAAA